MKLLKVESEAQWAQVYEVIRELRPHIDAEAFRRIVAEARARDEYEVVALYDDADRCVAAMGYRVLYDLVRGRHLYIDDLVVTEAARGKGLGAGLLKHAEDLAREKGCATLRLCTGLENAAGKRFYEREGWTARAVAYVKALPP